MSSNPYGSKSKLKQGPTSGSAIRQATRSSEIRRRPIPKHPDDGIALAKPAPPGESIASRTSLWPVVESTENQNAEICKVYNPETALPWPGQLPCSAQRKKRGETGPCSFVHPDHQLWSTLASKAKNSSSQTSKGTTSAPESSSIGAAINSPISGTITNTINTPRNDTQFSSPNRPTVGTSSDSMPLFPNSTVPSTKSPTTSRPVASNRTTSSLFIPSRHRTAGSRPLASRRLSSRANMDPPPKDSAMETLLMDFDRSLETSAEVAVVLNISTRSDESFVENPPLPTFGAEPKLDTVIAEEPEAEASASVPGADVVQPDSAPVTSSDAPPQTPAQQPVIDPSILVGASSLPSSSTNNGPSFPPETTATSQTISEPNSSTLPPLEIPSTPPSNDEAIHTGSPRPTFPFALLLTPSMHRPNLENDSVAGPSGSNEQRFSDTPEFRKMQAIIKDYSTLYLEDRQRSALTTRKREIDRLASKLEGRSQPKTFDTSTSLKNLASKIAAIEKQFYEKVVSMMDQEDHWLFVDPKAKIPILPPSGPSPDSAEMQTKMKQEMDALSTSVHTLKELLKQLHEGLQAMQTTKPPGAVAEPAATTPASQPPSKTPSPEPSPSPSVSPSLKHKATIEKMKKEIESLRDDVDNLRWAAENVFNPTHRAISEVGSEPEGKDATSPDAIEIDKEPDNGPTSTPAVNTAQTSMEIDTPTISGATTQPLSDPEAELLASRLAQAEEDLNFVAHATIECDVVVTGLQEKEQLPEFIALKNSNEILRTRLEKLKREAKQMDDFIMFANDAIAARVMVMSQPINPEKLKTQVLQDVQQDLTKLIEQRFAEIREGIKRAGSTVLENVKAEVQPTTELLREFLDTLKLEKSGGMNGPNGVNGH